MCAESRIGPNHDQGFRGDICLSFGTAGALSREHDGERPRHDIHCDCASAESLSQLRSEIEQARVGVRLVLAGPSKDVRAAAAVATECGLAADEVVLASDDSGNRNVYCAHCHSVTETFSPVNSEMQCQGCSTVLSIADHFSPRMAAYLGFAADIEEAA